MTLRVEMTLAVKAMLTVSPLLMEMLSVVAVEPLPAAMVAVLVPPGRVAVTVRAVGVVAGLPHVSSRLAPATQLCSLFWPGSVAVQARAVLGSVRAAQVTVTSAS